MGSGGSSSRSGRAGGRSNSKAVNAKMPELTGSPKQVSWAESIRADALRRADKLTDDFHEMQSRMPRDKKFAEDTLQYNLKDASVIRKEVVETFQSQTSASRIIDYRQEFSYNHLKELAQLEHRTGQVSEARKRRKK